MRNMKTILFAGLLVLGASSCSMQTEKTVWQFMPHMANTPILKALKGYDGFENGSSALMPPDNTIARGHRPYRVASVEEAEAKLVNPLPLNKVTLDRGKKVFNTYCMTCHGERGLGDGPVIDPFPIPKSLQSADMLKWKDGHLFHVITMGQGIMPSYAQQVQPLDRWAAIHYVRALQRAEHPTDADSAALKKQTANN